MDSVSIENLRKVSYLDITSLDGRVVNLMPLWENEQWHFWVSTPDGLIDIKPVDTIRVDYVARNPANEFDLLIPFVELMWQRASYTEICPIIRAICDDFHNMGTSVSKLRLFFDSRDNLQKSEITRFASTELEYLVILARTIFDLFQETIASIWKHYVRLIDNDLEKRRRGQNLPDTFSKIVLRNKKVLRTSIEIEREFGLPLQIANEYAKYSPFFLELRNSRDSIVHGGSEIGTIFDTEKGFCVNPQTKPFSSYINFNDNHRYNENLVSVLPWVADIVFRTIEACNALMFSLASVIKFPPEIAPGFHVFVRGPSNRALAEVLSIHDGGSPWWYKERSEIPPNKTIQPMPQNNTDDG